MSYSTLEAALQQHIASEPCWNIPTTLRMELLGSINALSTSLLDDSEKSAAFYTLLQKTLEQHPSSELETKQLIALNAFKQTHPWLNTESTWAILTDLCHLGMAEPVAA